MPSLSSSTQSRASRSADLTAVGVALVLPSLVTWAYFIWLHDAPAGLQQAVYSVGKTVQFAFPLAWVLLVQRRRLAWQPPTGAGVLLGICFGLLVSAAMLILYHLWLSPSGFFEVPGAAVREKIRGLGLQSTARYAALGMFYALCHSLLEEYYWRWFVFGQLDKLVSFRTALLVSSLGFMAHHVLLLATYFGWASPATWLFSVSVAVGGAVWAWLYHRSGSLYGPWISHLLVDAAIFLVGYDIARVLLTS